MSDVQRISQLLSWEPQKVRLARTSHFPFLISGGQGTSLDFYWLVLCLGSIDGVVTEVEALDDIRLMSWGEAGPFIPLLPVVGQCQGAHCRMKRWLSNVLSLLGSAFEELARLNLRLVSVSAAENSIPGTQ